MSKVEYRAVIKFLTKEGLAPAAIKQRLDGVYGEASPSYSTVNEWAKQFRIGRESVEDELRQGRPVEVVTFKVGQAGNLWTLPRTYTCGLDCSISLLFLIYPFHFAVTFTFRTVFTK